MNQHYAYTRITYRRLFVTTIIILCILGMLLAPSKPAAAVGEASTLFGVFIPVSMNPSRVATLVVTAVSDGTIMDITDKYSDGCQSVPVLSLNAGQSYILPVPGGSANDGIGPLQEGCYFALNANKPVVVANETTNSDWQHAFVPADNHRGVGSNFYLYRLQGLQNAFAAGDVFDAFAYTDNTEIRIIDITNGAGVFTGTTSVVPDDQGVVVFSAVLMAGHDLLEVSQKRASLVDGHTYHILSNNDISIQFGSLGKGVTGSRDGGAYVPGQTGYSVDTKFYFVVPYEQIKEREVRVVSYDNAALFTIRGWNTVSASFDTITTTMLSPYSHIELVGSALGVYTGTTGIEGYYYFQVTSDQQISVFESNWIETGSYGTSDTATYISSKEGTGAGTFFQTYIDPPGMHPYTTTMLSHLIVSTYNTATVTVADSDSFAEYIELYNNTSQTVDLTSWKLTNSANQAVIFPSGSTIPSGGVFVLQYHAQSTGTTPDFVYGNTYGDFRLGNGTDNISLINDTNNLVDSLVYTDAGWGNHGVYYSMERIDPNLAFTNLNVRDSAVLNPAGANNLGAFYGSPGVPNGAAGSLTGAVVINEVMTGRFYKKFTIPQLSYYDVTLDSSQWAELHNGSAPGIMSNSGHPENPYLIIQADSPVSILNSNWDDNWMAYATGVLRPDPILTLTLDRNQYQPNDAVKLNIVGLNKYSTLYQPVLSVVIPLGINYSPGNYQTAGLLVGITPTEQLLGNGDWQLTWSLSSTLTSGALNSIGPRNIRKMAPGTSSEMSVSITATINSNAQDGAMYQAVANISGEDDKKQEYDSQNTAVANVSSNTVAPTSNLLINEAMNNPGCSGDQWIELYNNGSQAIPIAGYELTNQRGLVYHFPASTPSLAGNNYLVVHLNAGTNITTSAPGAMQFYAGAVTINTLDLNDDQVALFNSNLRISSSLLDYMRWDITNTVVNRGDLDLAIASGNWLTGSHVLPPSAGQSMNRLSKNGAVSNTNSSADWGDGTASPGLLNNPTLVVPAPAAITNLVATPWITQEGSVKLTWTNPITSIDQLQIIRAPITYPTHLSDGLVITTSTNNANQFTDTGITQTTPVYYTAFSFRSGAVSCATTGAQAVALAPLRTILAFEDQKGSDWNDWDTNDFITAQDAAVSLNRSGITRIEAIFTALARGADYDHAMTLTIGLSGNSNVLVEQYTPSGILTGRQLTLVNGAVSTIVFTSTKHILPPNGGTFTTNTYTNTPQIKGPYTRVVITPTIPASNTLNAISTPPFDSWLYIKNTKASIHLILPGSVGNSQLVWDSRSPLYQRDLPLAQSFAHNWKWPLETHPIWQAYPAYTAFITSGGALNPNWFMTPDTSQLWETFKLPLRAGATLGPQRTTTTVANIQPRAARATGVLPGWPQAMSGTVFASPLIVDLAISGTTFGKILVNASQAGDVVAWNPNGSILWSHTAGAQLRSSPAAGDLSGNGRVAIVIGSDNGFLYGWYADDGSVFPGFPHYVGASIKSTTALAKLNGDTGLSIIFQTDDGKVHIINHIGIERPGWPQATGAVANAFGSIIFASTPAVGDLDGDGISEIVVGSTSGKVFAWHLDGTRVSELWPHTTGDWVYGSPVIVDLNQDGYRDVVIGSGDGYLYALRGDGMPLPGFPVYLGGAIAASPAVFDLDGDGSLEVLISTIEGKVFAIRSNGAVEPGWPVDMQATTYSSVAGADINSDGYPEVIVGSYKGLYAFNLNGTLVPGWPKQTGDWVVSSPAVGDLNGDRLVEIAIGSYDNRVYVFREYGVAHSTAFAWSNFRRDTAQTGFVPLDIAVLPLAQLHVYYMPLVYQQ